MSSSMMPAQSGDPISTALHLSLSSNAKRFKTSEDIDSRLVCDKQVLFSEIKYESSKCPSSNILRELQSKYIVLSTVPSSSKSEEVTTNSLKSAFHNHVSSPKKAISSGKEPTSLPSPRVVLYSPDKVQLGWSKSNPVGSGFFNLGNTCYLNSTLQALFHVPAFVNWLLGDNAHASKCESMNGMTHSECLVCAMSKTLVASQKCTGSSVKPVQIYNKLRLICKHLTHGHQEDAHEFLRYLVEGMERSYLTSFNGQKLDTYSKETTPLNQIFGGYLRSEVTCLECKHVSTTFQHFQDLLLDIRTASSVDEALESFFSRERLGDGDQAYRCEQCKRRVAATKKFSIERPPKALCIALKRFGAMGGKNNKTISMKQILDISKFRGRGVGGGEPSQYKLVSMVTHLGPSSSCGHYTAVGLTSSGTYYLFDDSLVKSIPIQSVLNSNPYILIYEMETESRRLPSPVPLRKEVSNGFGTSNGISSSNSSSRAESCSKSASPSPPPSQSGSTNLVSRPAGLFSGGSLLAVGGGGGGPSPRHRLQYRKPTRPFNGVLTPSLTSVSAAAVQSERGDTSPQKNGPSSDEGSSGGGEVTPSSGVQKTADPSACPSAGPLSFSAVPASSKVASSDSETSLGEAVSLGGSLSQAVSSPSSAVSLGSHSSRNSSPIKRMNGEGGEKIGGVVSPGGAAGGSKGLQQPPSRSPAGAHQPLMGPTGKESSTSSSEGGQLRRVNSTAPPPPPPPPPAVAAPVTTSSGHHTLSLVPYGSDASSGESDSDLAPQSSESTPANKISGKSGSSCKTSWSGGSSGSVQTVKGVRIEVEGWEAGSQSNSTSGGQHRADLHSPAGSTSSGKWSVTSADRERSPDRPAAVGDKQQYSSTIVIERGDRLSNGATPMTGAATNGGGGSSGGQRNGGDSRWSAAGGPQQSDSTRYNSNSSSPAISHLIKTSHRGYGNQVKSWSGGRSELDLQVEGERHYLKRSHDSYNDDFDRGKVKKVKKYHHGGGNESYGNNGRNRFQEAQNRKNWRPTGPKFSAGFNNYRAKRINNFNQGRSTFFRN